MSRQLTVAVLVAGLIAVPFGTRLVDVSSKTAVAQDGDLDLIVIEPVDKEPIEDIPLPFLKDVQNQDLIVVEPVAEDPQSVYLELARLKAKLLLPDALEREIQALRQELIELQATQKLREAESQLRRLAEEHPTTNAAERARRMLESVRHMPLDAPRRNEVPLPDPGFDRTVPDADDTPFEPQSVPARRSPQEGPRYRPGQ